MADPMRIRAQAQGSGAVVRVLMSHEMETGQRKDADGKVIPAWHITEVTAALNGKTVMTAHWGTAIAARMPMMATTTRSSTRVKPLCRLPRIGVQLVQSRCHDRTNVSRAISTSMAAHQRRCVARMTPSRDGSPGRPPCDP